MNTTEVWLLHFVLLRLAWGRRSAKRFPTPVHAIFVKPGDVICPYCGHGLKVHVDKRTSYVCGHCNEVVVVGVAIGDYLYCSKPGVPTCYDPELPVAKDMGPSSAMPRWRR